MIKKEVGFGKDNFGKARILNNVDSISQILLMILLSRPGNFPSMPHIGINIKSYLYKNEDEIDVIELKSKIYSQCQELLSLVVNNDIKFYIDNKDGQDILILFIPVAISEDVSVNEQEGIMFAFTQTEKEGLTYIHKYQRIKNQ